MCRGGAPSTPPAASFAQRLSLAETTEVPWQPNSSSPSTGAPPAGRLPCGDSLRPGQPLPRPPPPPPPPPPPLAQAGLQEEAQMTHVAHVAQPPGWMPLLLGPVCAQSTPPSAAAAAGAPSAPWAAAPSAADGAPSG